MTENIDVVVRAGVAVPDRTDLVAHALQSFPRTVVGAPSYLDAHGRPSAPNALGGHTCLLQVNNTGTVDRWRLTRGGRERAVEVRGRFSATAPQILLDSARAGLGLAFLPPWLTQPAVDRGELERVLPGWESPPIAVHAIYRRSRRGSAAVRAFIEAMTSHAT